MASTAAYGSGPPSSSVSPGADYYVDADSSKLYGPKVGSNWPLTSIQLPIILSTNPIVLVAADLPNPGDGSVGNYFVDTSTEQFYGPKTSSGWGVGTKYNSSYSRIRSGDGPPDDHEGTIGDQYIDTTNHIYYGPKTASGWPDGFSLVGPQGDSPTLTLPTINLQGLSNIFFYSNFPPDSGMGREGDLYLDTQTKVFYGPKKHGKWPVLGKIDRDIVPDSRGTSWWFWILFVLILVVLAAALVYYFYYWRRNR
jgi:hypothetical protein